MAIFTVGDSNNRLTPGPRIGAIVTATDSLLGRVDQVILSPAQRRVVGLVVRVGWLPHRDLFVPTELIADAAEQEITLRVHRN